MTELHVPPADLIEAIREALHQADRLSPDPAIAAEQITYSIAFQHYLGTLRATDATGNAQDAHEAREAIQVECRVVVPLGGVTRALDVLQRIPISAAVSWNTGKGLVAEWTEPR